MKAKEQALDLFVKFYQLIPDYAIEDNEIASGLAKQCAIICVQEMESILTAYGDDKFELQNMDYMWRYLDDVKNEIEKI